MSSQQDQTTDQGERSAQGRSDAEVTGSGQDARGGGTSDTSKETDAARSEGFAPDAGSPGGMGGVRSGGGTGTGRPPGGVSPIQGD